MREIKFRGKRIDNGEWVEGYYFETQMSGVYIIGTKLDIQAKKENIKMQDKLWQHEVDPATVGQYTGLKDKHGKEIYEGDIVLLHDKNETKTSHKSEVYFGVNGITVDYHPTHKRLGLGDRRWLHSYLMNGEETICEVIGNIYEHSHLL